MSRLSERLLAQQKTTLDTAPLRKAIRELQRALERSPKARLYAESLAARPTFAVGKLVRGEDRMTITASPSRDLGLFLNQASRATVKSRRAEGATEGWIQNDSGSPQGPASGFRGTLRLR